MTIEELSVPDPEFGQVLVRLAVSGICHTQILEIEGKRGEDRFLPHCLGHEGSGIVEKTGKGVTRVKTGDPVILSWIKAGGINSPSIAYFQGEKKINAGAITTFNEYALVSENRVTRIPGEMPLDKAALIGCAIPTGAGAVFNTAKVQPGSSVVVFGTGGVGVCAVQAAAISNAGSIIAVDISDTNLERARSFGATHIVNPQKENPVETILELTQGRGADYAIECAGRKETMEQAFMSIRKFGGLEILIGNLPFQEKISIDPFQLICGKRIVGSWGGETNPDRDFPKYVDLYLSGKLKLDTMITHRFPLEKINDAFELMRSGKVGRAIIEF